GRLARRVETSASGAPYHSDSLLFDGRGKLLTVGTTTFGTARSLGFSYAGLGATLSADGPQAETYTRDPLGNAVTRSVAASLWAGGDTNHYEPHSTRFSWSAGTPALHQVDS